MNIFPKNTLIEIETTQNPAVPHDITIISLYMIGTSLRVFIFRKRTVTYIYNYSNGQIFNG